MHELQPAPSPVLLLVEKTCFSTVYLNSNERVSHTCNFLSIITTRLLFHEFILLSMQTPIPIPVILHLTYTRALFVFFMCKKYVRNTYVKPSYQILVTPHPRTFAEDARNRFSSRRSIPQPTKNEGFLPLLANIHPHKFLNSLQVKIVKGRQRVYHKHVTY